MNACGSKISGNAERKTSSFDAERHARVTASARARRAYSARAPRCARSRHSRGRQRVRTDTEALGAVTTPAWCVRAQRARAGCAHLKVGERVDVARAPVGGREPLSQRVARLRQPVAVRLAERAGEAEASGCAVREAGVRATRDESALSVLKCAWPLVRARPRPRWRRCAPWGSDTRASRRCACARARCIGRSCCRRAAQPCPQRWR